MKKRGGGVNGGACKKLWVMCLLSHLSGEQSVQNISPPNNCALLMKRTTHFFGTQAHTHIVILT